MRLFDFVEQHDGIWIAADRFREHSAAAESHITWRRSLLRNSGNGMSFPDIRTYSQPPCSNRRHKADRQVQSLFSVFPTPLGPTSRNTPTGLPGSTRSAREVQNTPRNRIKRGKLPDDSFCHVVLQFEHAANFVCHHFADRNSRPPGNYRRNSTRVHTRAAPSADPAGCATVVIASTARKLAAHAQKFFCIRISGGNGVSPHLKLTNLTKDAHFLLPPIVDRFVLSTRQFQFFQKILETLRVIPSNQLFAFQDRNFVLNARKSHEPRLPLPAACSSD